MEWVAGSFYKALKMLGNGFGWYGVFTLMRAGNFVEFPETDPTKTLFLVNPYKPYQL